MRLRRAARSARGREVARPDLRPAPARPAALSLDAVVVPALLLLVARDLVLHDPPRVLAWRFLHDPRLMAVPAWLAALLPRPPAGFDRDPVGLLLGALASGLALCYLAASLLGASTRLRAGLLSLAGLVVVVVPTLALIAMGAATGRPYGQDGGVVQLPLALDKILAGQSPYGADYSDSMLGKQARVSDFWAAHGGNPILRHHAYLPGTHLFMLPFHLASRAARGGFDPRSVTLLAWAAAAVLAARLAGGGARGLAAAAAVLVSPLVYWHQVFGANDVLPAVVLLAAVAAGEAGRPVLAGALLGLACATRQLAWPFAPFLLVHLSGARSYRDLLGPAARRLAAPLAASAAFFLVVVVPVAALDFRAFWADTVVYNAGLRGGDNYPLGGTPGFGFANLLIYAGAVSSLREHVPLGMFYLLLVPLGLWLLRVQMREGGAGLALVSGSAALLAALYVSRVVHPNYLVLAAILLPVGLLIGARRAADVAVVPLLLLALAAEVAEQEVLREAWQQAAAFGLPRRAEGVLALLLPRAGPQLTVDPLGLLLSAVVAGLAVVFLWAGVLGVSAAVRRLLVGGALVIAVVVPALAVAGLGRGSGALRAQDPWVAEVAPGSPRVVEAWSPSFRRDPPAPLTAEGPGAPGSAAVRGALALMGWRDPRLLLVLAFGACAALVSRAVGPARQPLALGAALLSPAMAVAVTFGTPAVIGLTAVVAAALLVGGGWTGAGALVLGAGSAVVPVTAFAAPVILLAPAKRRARSAIAGFVAGLLMMALPALVANPRSGWRTLTPEAAVEPGIGLSSLLLYRDAAGAAAGGALAVLRVATFAAAVLVWLRSRAAGGPAAAGWAAAAGFVLLGLWLEPGGSAHALAVPLGMLALAGVSRADAVHSSADNGNGSHRGTETQRTN